MKDMFEEGFNNSRMSEEDQHAMKIHQTKIKMMIMQEHFKDHVKHKANAQKVNKK